jgi:hypothetical protein
VVDWFNHCGYKDDMQARPWRFSWLAALVLGAGSTACTEPDDGPAPTPSCSSTTYRVAAVELARTWGDAPRLGLDIDGDGDVDNKLGSLNATLTQVYGDWDPSAGLTRLLASTTTAWLVKVERCDDTPRLAMSLGLGTGDDGRFDTVTWGKPAIGDGPLVRGGEGVLPVGRLGDGASVGGDDGWSSELGLTVAVRSEARDLVANVGLGVEVTDELLAPVAGFLSAALARGDSRFAAGIDLDRDGVVSVAELRQAPAVRSLLASDLDLTGACVDGVCAPGRDGALDRISLGFGLTARPITLP